MTETRSYDTRFRGLNVSTLFLSLLHSYFEFVSDFDIRILDFSILYYRFGIAIPHKHAHRAGYSGYEFHKY